jgi:hypothetical protein
MGPRVLINGLGINGSFFEDKPPENKGFSFMLAVSFL